MNNYKFDGIINGFTLDENLIDGNVICDVEKQILCVSSKAYISSKYININNFDKNNLSYFEKFLIIFNSYLIRNPEYIIFKNMFCDFEYEDIKKVKVLFRAIKKDKFCKIIICSKNTDLLLDLCDYVVTADCSGEIIEVFKNSKNNIPFCIKFAQSLEEYKNKKIGIYRNNIDDLAKDVYRFEK